MERLDANAREALERYKASLGPSADEAREVWAEIQARTAQQPANDEPGAARGGARWRWTAALGMVAAAAAVVAIVAVSVRAGRLDPQRHDAQSVAVDDGASPTRQASSVEEQDSARSTSPPASSPAAQRQPIEPDPEPDPEPESTDSEPVRGSQPTSRPKRRRPAAVEDTAVEVSPLPDPLEQLQAEAALLRRARAALASAQHATVLEAVREHRASFASGTMIEEFAVLELQALCGRGETQRWSDALERFDRRYPNSPLRVHVRQDCER